MIEGTDPTIGLKETIDAADGRSLADFRVTLDIAERRFRNIVLVLVELIRLEKKTNQKSSNDPRGHRERLPVPSQVRLPVRPRLLQSATAPSGSIGRTFLKVHLEIGSGRNWNRA